MAMTKEQIDKARKMREEGVFYREIGKSLGLSYSIVYRALNPAAREQQAVYRATRRATHKEELATYFASYYTAHKERIAVRGAAYYAAHREERAVWGAAYYAAHKKEHAASGAAYHATHREELDAYYAAYRKAHKKEIAIASAAYYATHKEKHAATMAAYNIAHKDQIRQYRRDHAAEIYARNAAYRALIVGAAVGATIGQKAEIKEVYRRAVEGKKVRCYLCGHLIPKGHRHVDHIIPLSKGGAHRPSNLAVACDTCNLKKNNKLPVDIGILI